MELKEPTKEELAKIEEIMKSPEVAKAAGVLLASWRLYWLARAEIIRAAKGAVNDANFPILSQSLSKAAMGGFKVGRFKNHMKNYVMPFLRSLAAKEARLSEVIGDAKPDPDPEPECGGDEAVGQC